MGLLNRRDSLIYRKFFSEMCKLIGISVGYQYITKKEMTIHSEDNSEFSMPIRLDILFDENPSVDTLNRLGWVSEINDNKPIVINVPYNTPHLTVNARIIVESTDGTPRPRVFRITTIKSDLEYPDAYTCIIAPVFDQYVQRNQYTLINNEKINQKESERTSKDQPYKYLTGEHTIDNAPQENIDYENKYSFINENNSPYSG